MSNNIKILGIDIKRQAHKTKTMKLKNIKITDEFKAHPPRPEKLALKYKIFYYDLQALSPIVINKKKELIDGFCTFLLSRMLGYETIEVRVEVK